MLHIAETRSDLVLHSATYGLGFIAYRCPREGSRRLTS
jgi:hypothetical protein